TGQAHIGPGGLFLPGEAEEAERKLVLDPLGGLGEAQGGLVWGVGDVEQEEFRAPGLVQPLLDLAQADDVVLGHSLTRPEAETGLLVVDVDDLPSLIVEDHHVVGGPGADGDRLSDLPEPAEDPGAADFRTTEAVELRGRKRRSLKGPLF